MSQLPVIAIRPEPGLSKTITAGKEAGLAITGFPLSGIEPLAWVCPDPAQFDALLVGSANAFRHGGEALNALRDLPVLAVGSTTSQAARDNGFQVKMVGEGGLQTLIDQHGAREEHWLRLAGEEHVPLELPDNLKLTTRIVYRLETAELPPKMLKALSRECVVLLHSAVAAERFQRECDANNVDRSRIALAALGPRIVEGLDKGWKSVDWAETPKEEALLALANRLCETI